MPPDKRKPPARDRRLPGDDVEFAGFDIPKVPLQPRTKQVLHRHRVGFARAMVFEAFGYRHGRAIDYDGFVDRKPTLAPVWWRAEP